MINLELLTQSGDHSVIQVCTVVHDDPVGDTVIGGNRTDCFRMLVREMSRKQESPPSFIFSKWKGQKHRKIPYIDCSRFGR